MSTSADISKRYYQKWSDLTEEQRGKSGTQADHAARRAEYGLTGVNVDSDTKRRMAGDAIVQMNRSEDPNKAAIDAARDVVYEGGIEGFDAAAGGRGALANKEIISKADLKGMLKAETAKTGDKDASKQSIIDFVNANPEMDSSGNGAQTLLGKWTEKLSSTTEPGPPDEEEGGPPETEDKEPVGPPETEDGRDDDSGGTTTPTDPYDESVWEGDSPGSTKHFVDHFVGINRENQKYWDNQAAQIAPNNWAVFGKDNDYIYDNAMTEYDENIVKAESDAAYNGLLLYGDIERYSTPKFVMDWNQEDVDTTLEDDDIDFD